MKRRWKKFLAGVLSAALALNLAAPLALADSGEMYGGRSWNCLVMQNSVPNGSAIDGTGVLSQ